MIRTPDGFVAELDADFDDAAIAHLFHRDRLIQRNGAPELMTLAEHRAAGFAPERLLAVGRYDGRLHIALALADDREPELPEDWRITGMRNWFGRLPDAHLAIALRAMQLLEWQRTHRFCGACGTPTKGMPGERALQCPACRLSVYPRISPAMMVLVTRGRELLLARGVNFPPDRYSALAGFLEAGESIEDAIHREVREEVGVRVGALRYFASQSWPFPNSLMIAFTAEWISGDITPDPAEIADAQWFDIDALPGMPPRNISISRALIDDTVRRIRAGG
ncbi:MAG: NAD(+) diphosphatase [Lautropia sp.]